MLLILTTGLTPDESYYFGYATYPQWSYFDHPGMVGWLIRASTMNLTFNSEFFIRFFSLVLGTLNLILVFKITALVKNQKTGILAMLLAMGSPYAVAYTGVYMIPDVPMLFLWLLSIYYTIKYILEGGNKNLIVFGVLVGLSILSKYNAVFLWLGMLYYLFKYQRSIFRSKYLYLSLLCTIIVILPIVIWNFENDFVSLTFHYNRINNSTKALINLEDFSEGIWGMVVVQSPINVLIIGVILFKARKLISKPVYFFLFWTGIPFILAIVFINLFNWTLPHWNGPGWISLLILTACIIDDRFYSAKLHKLLWFNLVFMVCTSILFCTYVHTGKPKSLEGIRELEESIYMYQKGWEQVDTALEKMIPEDSVTIFAHNWFYASYFEYTIMDAKEKDVFVFGDIIQRRNYHFSNATLQPNTPDVKQGGNAYYFTSSSNFRYPELSLLNKFEIMVPMDTIKVTRKGEWCYDFFVYKLISCKNDFYIKTTINITQNPIDNKRTWKEDVISSNTVRYNADFEYDKLYQLPLKVTKDVGFKSSNSCKMGPDFRQKSHEFIREVSDLTDLGVVRLDSLSFKILPKSNQSLKFVIQVRKEDQIKFETNYKIDFGNLKLNEWNPYSIRDSIDITKYRPEDQFYMYLEVEEEGLDWIYVDDMNLFFGKK